MKRFLGLALALTFGLLPSLYAQIATGNIYGTVTDESGALLPGVTIKLTSDFGTRETVADSQGNFRFLNLNRGTYQVSVGLPGFTKVNRDVIVNVGTNVSLTFSLKVATVEETVTVTAQTPVVDTKKVGTATTLTKEELEKVPSARDPWAILRTIPGIIQDRVNIGGNENGQQANFVSKGDNGDNAMWNLDGVVVTDTGATGASPTYYDFDAFEEIAVATGGNDVRIQTGGANINFTTRRGTNKFRGSLHDYFTHDDLQSNNLPDALKGDARLKGAEKGDHIQQIHDFGGELGGPIIKDKLWFYGSWGRQDIRLVRINQTSDKTKLTSYNAKLNWQAGPNDMVSLFYFNGEKTKEGRDPGFGIQAEDSFLWNQGGVYGGGPHGFMKLEWNHTFSSNFFASFKGSRYNTGFFLHPRGGDITGTADFDAGVARGAYLSVDITRPAETATVDANYFKPAWGGNHELKFGFGYRRFKITSTTHWGGNQLFAYNFGPGYAYVHVARDAVNATKSDYLGAYVGDTFTKDRLTLNLGVRWDRQKGKTLPSTAPANRSFPNILPALSYDGGREGIEWSDLSPRVGFTYALDESHKTILRASYAWYAGQLPSGQATFVSPIQSPGSYFAYIWDDVNGDGFATPNEVRTDLGLQYFNYVNPDDTTGPSPNQIDPDYKNQRDHEVIVGLERELVPNLSVAAAYTYRKGTDIISWTPRIGLTSADYTVRNFSARGFTAVGYVPNGAKVAATGGGRILMNRPDYSRSYQGLEFTLTKRLSNKWMARLGFTYQNPTENIEGPGAIQSPTRTDTTGGLVSGPQVDGGLYSPRSSGSGKGDALIGAKWQIVGNALVQLPGSVELSASLFGRQGHPRAIVLRRGLGDDGTLRILATENPEIDTNRYPNVWNVDARLAKNFKLGASSFTVAADVFNVFNANTELTRFRQATSSAFNRLDEILNPRIVRFSVRYQF